MAETMQTRSGRTVTLPATKGRIEHRLAQIDAWLIREAITEAKARSDEHNRDRFAAMRPSVPLHRRGKSLWLTPAERDDLNLYLFDELEGLAPASWPVWRAA